MITASPPVLLCILLLALNPLLLLLVCADANHIDSDRKVLLAAFQLEGILSQHLYGDVMTLVDLKNESNMYLLRQEVSN